MARATAEAFWAFAAAAVYLLLVIYVCRRIIRAVNRAKRLDRRRADFYVRGGQWYPDCSAPWGALRACRGRTRGTPPTIDSATCGSDTCCDTDVILR